MTADVVVVGSINLDLVTMVARHPRPGETLLGTGSFEAPGGKGANQAVAAALRGARTAMIGAVGSDERAPAALRLLASANVDLSQVARVPGATGLAVITVADDGENTIVVVPGANAAVDATQVDDAVRQVGPAGVAVLQAELPVPVVEHAMRVLAANGARIILNAAPATVFGLEALRLVDVLVVNEHEGGTVLSGATGAPAPADPAAIARDLRGLGVPAVVITLGAAGCLVADSDGEWSLPAVAVPVVDTTGAGDAFVGALAAALSAGTPLRDAAVQATRVAAYAVMHSGAQPSYPTRDKELP